ncbi:hypothetical protein Ocin01_13283 [Orchesella cincta]|uniref:Uncharacterized protein n=1 Tax=Orchesella cincta TaxID=48709 RepID=A0A1D2MKN3_ORCCI|nr:hypothetical protein Ocin01_13283 [Orchesella cincta]
MASYLFHDSEVFSSSSSENEGSEFEASIEQLRGTAARRPSFLFPDEVEAEEEERVEPPRGFFEEFEVPLEQRRQIPGCGINHHEIFDESAISAETVPIQPKPANFEVEYLFDQFDHDSSASAMVGARNFIESHFQQRQYSVPQRDRQPRRFRMPPGFATYDRNGIQYPLSPLSTSSSSSSSSGSEDEGFPGNLRTLPSSTFMSTQDDAISSLPQLIIIHRILPNKNLPTPESSPMHSFDNAFQPLHASTFVNRASLSEPDFTDYVSLSRTITCI